MLRLYVTLLAVRSALLSRFEDDDPERGNFTIENVLWAVAVIAIVGIVVVAIKSYVTDQAELIQ
ncbi:hypothetical protein ET495_08050 [Xylanimonas allomyrinae]|uniref:Uncharacterized protein n=1 Tax=Xylanimonas allomyrinae TaxID=2509459 RepID=A0A4P6EPA6_9MICO|nr:hypothetical protein [Xylanimonas allomyrinae]QAY63199.1 hypothetical protein ET495_08050 [Xylanimonas allomyrinae]